MVAEENPLVGGLKILAIAQALGGRGAMVIQSEDARGDELAVEAIAGSIGAGGSDDEPDAIDGLTAPEREGAEANGGGEGEEGPEDGAKELHASE